MRWMKGFRPYQAAGLVLALVGLGVGGAMAAWGLGSGLVAKAADSAGEKLVWEEPKAQSADHVARSPDGVLLASAQAGPVQTPSAAQAWGGPRTGREETLSNRVVDYTIHAKLDTERHTIEGRQQLVWRNRSERPIRSVYLHLYINAFASSGSTFMREQQDKGFGFRSQVAMGEGEWGYTELRSVKQGGEVVPWVFVQPDQGPASDRTVVRLDLPQEVPAGGSTTLNMEFFNQLPRVVARTGYFGSFHLVAQWFPKMAVLELPGERGATEPRWNAHEFHLHSEFYADFGRFDVTIDVPKGVVVGATGREVKARQEQGGRWVYRFEQGDVHDFAFVADSRLAEPLIGHYQGEDGRSVEIRVYHPPEYASNAQPVLRATQQSLAFFAKALGPYPYQTVTAVVPPYNAGEAGGMEYPTFFTADSVLRLEAGTLASYALDFVTIHEFGHGYFYGILASNEFEEPWLDEGLNEYLNLRMIHDSGRRIPLTNPWLKKLGFAPSIAPFEAERLMTVQGEPSDALAQNSWNRRNSGSYSSVYSRTATLMRGLEAEVGTEKMDRALRAYYQEWKFRHPSSADFMSVLARETGRPEVIERVFAQQVWSQAQVDDRVTGLQSTPLKPEQGWHFDAQGRAHKLKDAPASGERSGSWRTLVELRRFGAAVPQEVVVTFADGSTERVRWDDNSRWKRYAWVKSSKAVRVELDPNGHHTLDVNRLDNSRLLEADGRASRRVLSDAAAWIQTVLAGVSLL